MSPRPQACVRHRTALVDFADRREHGPGLDDALDHLDRCPGCRADVEAIALTVTALRRLGLEAGRNDPPPAAWARLRDRLEAPSAPLWRVRTTLGAIVVGAALAGTLVAPRVIWQPRPPIENDSLPRAMEVYLDRAEQLVQRSRFGTPLPPDAPILAPGEAGGSWGGPDGIGVEPTEMTDVVPADRVR